MREIGNEAVLGFGGSRTWNDSKKRGNILNRGKFSD